MLVAVSAGSPSDTIPRERWQPPGDQFMQPNKYQRQSGSDWAAFTNEVNSYRNS